MSDGVMEFRVLGPLQVVDGDRAVALGGPMQRAVLALLLLEPNRVVSMDRLVDGLWGEDPPARATGTVQGYVSSLRHALEPGRRPGEPPGVLVWRAPGYTLQVAPEDVDWLRFERLLEQARKAHATGDLPSADALLTQAGTLWRGPPLADLGEVAVPERVRLDALRLGAVEEHAEVLLALGRHDEVADDLAAAAAQHPLRERLRGLQLLALYRAGRQVEALEVYTQVRRRLAEEHGVDPGAELQRLHQQVLRQDPRLAPARPAAAPAAPGASTVRVPPPTTPVKSPPATPAGSAPAVPMIPGPLVGRVGELAALRAHLSTTQAGSGRVVLLEGEPGVGKTRLVEEVAAEAAARGFLTLWGRCAEARGAPPLWPWAQVLHATGDSRDLAELVPNRARLDPRAARGRLHQQLTDLLRERARERPLLLVLEDLQWADEASFAPLEFLAANLVDARILVVGTYREVDLPHAPGLTTALGVLARLPGADRVALRGLDVGEVASLIRIHTGATGVDADRPSASRNDPSADLSLRHSRSTSGLADGRPVADIAAAVHERTEGNPFFIIELLRLGDPAALTRGPVPVGVRDVVRRRVARLPPAARVLLDTAALVGRDVDLRLVGGLCGLEGDATLVAAEAALVEGLLAVVPDRVGVYRFTHALVQETLARDLSPVHRARLHERIALALLDAYGEDGEHAAEVAEHLWRSLPAGDTERTLRGQARAAEVAWAGLAYEHAEALLERASGLLRSLPPAAAAAGALPDIDLDVHIRLGSLRSARHGYTTEVREAFDRARMLAKRLDRRGDLLPALWGLSATAVVRGDLTTAGEVNATALEEARHLPGGPALAIGHLGVGIVAFYRGRLAEARERFAAALAAWQDAAGDPSRSQADAATSPGVLRGPPASARPDVMACSYDALAACLMGDPVAARRQITVALRTTETAGAPYLVAFVHSFHARLAVLEGDREAARATATRAAEVAEAHGFPQLAAEDAVVLGWARAGQGEPEAGLAGIERGLGVLHRSGARILTPFHRGLQAEVLLILGDPAAALTLLEDALAESAARGGGFETPRLRHLRAEALDARGEG